MNHPFLLLGVSGGEFLIIALIFLLLFGPNQISSIARSAAKMIKRVRHATNDIKREILESSENKEFTEIKKTIKEGSEAYKEVTNTIKRGTKL